MFLCICLFQLFDQDDDGTITEKEFACIIQSALGLPDLDVSNLFKEIDADETGKLSYGKLRPFITVLLIVILTTESSQCLFSSETSDGSHTLFLWKAVVTQM